MKRMAAVIAVLILLLSGCANAESEIECALALRTKLLGSGCSFSTEIKADYGDEVFLFALSCRADADGGCTFTVDEPDSIAGITGRISGERGELTFDDTALAFSLMADDQISPVSAPWIFLKALRGGYLRAAGMDGELLRVSINDSYEEDAMQLDVWLDRENCPVRAEISYGGYTILSLDVSNFKIG